MTETSPAFAPMQNNGRIELLDILRGFALLGILLVNFPGGIGGWQTIDRSVMVALDLLVRSSFYPLFSILFGMGIAIQARRWRTRRASGIQLHLRRMAILALLGTIHATLIWSGDILFDYALFGIILLPLRGLGRRTLLVLVVVLAAVQLELPRWRAGATGTDGGAAAGIEAALVAGAREVAAADRTDELVAGRGTLRGDIAVRWWQYVAKVGSFTNWRQVLGRDVLLLFMIGLLVGRTALEAPASGVSARRVLLAACMAAAVAVTGNVYLHVTGGGPVELRRLASMFANYGVTAALACTMWGLWLNGGKWAARLRVLAAAGRMALTNYLLQSIVMTWLFAPYGVHIARPGAAASLSIGLAFFFWVQLPFSHWWLQSFAYGPVEWLWRRLTYGAPQRFRIRGAVAPTAALA